VSSDINGVGNSPDEMPDTMPSDEPFETPEELLEHADLELITDYLTGRLPAEQIADVKRRLDEDEAFREFAAPLVLAWSVPPRWQRHPMPRAELEKQWDRFTKRVGFVHQRRKARRRRLWLIGTVATLIVLGAIVVLPVVALRLAQGPLGEGFPSLAGYHGVGDFVPVSDSGGWMSIGRTRVDLAPGARLSQGKAAFANTTLLKLEGAGRFVHRQAPGASPLTDLTGTMVLTDAGAVMINHGDVRINARTDTTDVAVLRAQNEPTKDATKAPRGEADPLLEEPDFALIAAIDGPPSLLQLGAGEIGRLLRGHKPVKLRAVRDTASDNNPLMKLFFK
jgi:hypothetical protein